MGTHIDAAATSHPHSRLFGRGALHLTDAAARSCLARGHHRPGELELVINVGLYKDHGLAEPALASMIQEDIGANLGHPPQANCHGTFSFDVLNGGCGVLTAAQLIDGFVATGTAKHGLIVAGDADPSPSTSRRFPFAPAGGAILLSHDDGDIGFQRFVFRTFPEHAGMFEVHTRWDPHAGLVRRGRNVLEVYQAPAFSAHCIEHGIEVAGELLRDVGLVAADIDLLVASQYPRSFAAEIARGLGIPTARVPRVPAELARAHTAGPIAALEAAIKSGKFARAKHTLFVTAGAGITIGAALYGAPVRDRQAPAALA
jgi:3-oxoacyl-[acyl-carrier-protein] synthase-3